MADVYRNPLRGIRNLVPERIDMGVDYSGTGPVFALGPGIIRQTRNAGWPGGTFIAEELTAGPYQGKYVYFAEDISPAVRVGQKVTSATKVGDAYAGGSGIEVGWAAPPPQLGATMAAVTGQIPRSGDPGGDATGYGRSFSDLLRSLGAPAGLIQSPKSGGIPASYPGGSPFGPTKVPSQYQPMLRAASKVSGVPLPVVAAQINYESGFDPKAVSSAGAEGIAQFMPGTWKSYGQGSPFDAAAAMIAYAKYMRVLLKQEKGSLRNALAAYNAGPGNVKAGLGYADHILSAAGTSGGTFTAPAGGGGGQGGSGGSSWVAGILHEDERLIGMAGSGLGAIASGGPLGDIGAGIAQVSHDLAHVAAIIDWFIVPSHWLRIFAGIGGSVMVISGAWTLTHVGGDLPLAGPVTQGAALPIGMILVGLGAILLFVAFHNLDSAGVTDFPSLLGYLSQAAHGQAPPTSDKQPTLAEFLSASPS